MPSDTSVRAVSITSICWLVFASNLVGQQLQSVFPVVARTGESTEVAFTGVGLDEISAVYCAEPRLTFESVGNDRFTVSVGPDVPPGTYDLQIRCSQGLSSVRALSITSRPHIVESDPDSLDAPMRPVQLGCAISGRIAKGDIDQYRFRARKGDRVVIECWSERIDSALRAVLELYDARGRRLAVSRGFFGVDPVLATSIPHDGEFVVRLHDLVYAGGRGHFYRLDIGAEPRVVFAVPPVLQSGVSTEVTLYGWNLGPGHRGATPHGGALGYESTVVQLTAPDSARFPPVRRRPCQVQVDSFAYYYPGVDSPLAIGLAPGKVEMERDGADAADHLIDIPSDVTGQLTHGGERDFYAIDVRRGEVVYFEAYGERIGAPVDLELAVLDAARQFEFATFHDETDNVGGVRFPSNHLDPIGRWVVPADGRYTVMIRDLIGGAKSDLRRVYHLAVRREEPDIRLVALSPTDSPAGINLPRGGRAVVDVLGFRRRGLAGSVRVSARNLPSGVTCSDIWLGPGVQRVPLVLTAAANAPDSVAKLDLVAHLESNAVPRRSQYGTMVRAGVPGGAGRLTTSLPFLVQGESPIQISADCHESRDHHLYGALSVRHSPGGVVDVAVRVRRRDASYAAPVQLTAIGLPEMVGNQTATIAPGETEGYVSFYLPKSLAVGHYSFAIRAQTTVPTNRSATAQVVTAHSNTVSFQVHPPAFQLELDVAAPTKIRRGETASVNYTARRVNGFISKIHTELAAPGRVQDVGRLRGRGVTFVGQTESGTIQIIANSDAELGRIPFLRLYAVGVLEDEPIFHGSCFLPLEIIE